MQTSYETEAAAESGKPAERRLSPLQHTILRIALEGREYEEDRPRNPGDRWNGVDAYTAEIFATAFLGVDLPVAERKRRRQRFSMTAIGENRYRSGKASISRAITRLASRGLITVMVGRFSRWTGVSLTSDGLRLTRRQIYRSVNRGMAEAAK